MIEGSPWDEACLKGWRRGGPCGSCLPANTDLNRPPRPCSTGQALYPLHNATARLDVAAVRRLLLNKSTDVNEVGGGSVGVGSENS